MAKNIYREAAKLCYRSGRAACCCIWAVTEAPSIDPGADHTAIPFQNMFKPEDTYWTFWLGPVGDETDAQAHEHRILALCFAAAMHDAGDL